MSGRLPRSCTPDALRGRRRRRGRRTRGARPARPRRGRARRAHRPAAAVRRVRPVGRRAAAGRRRGHGRRGHRGAQQLPAGLRLGRAARPRAHRGPWGSTATSPLGRGPGRALPRAARAWSCVAPDTVSATRPTGPTARPGASPSSAGRPRRCCSASPCSAPSVFVETRASSSRSCGAEARDARRSARWPSSRRPWWSWPARSSGCGGGLRPPRLARGPGRAGRRSTAARGRGRLARGRPRARAGVARARGRDPALARRCRPPRLAARSTPCCVVAVAPHRRRAVPRRRGGRLARPGHRPAARAAAAAGRPGHRAPRRPRCGRSSPGRSSTSCPTGGSPPGSPCSEGCASRCAWPGRRRSWRRRCARWSSRARTSRRWRRAPPTARSSRPASTRACRQGRRWSRRCASASVADYAALTPGGTATCGRPYVRRRAPWCARHRGGPGRRARPDRPPDASVGGTAWSVGETRSALAALMRTAPPCRRDRAAGGPSCSSMAATGPLRDIAVTAWFRAADGREAGVPLLLSDWVRGTSCEHRDRGARRPRSPTSAAPVTLYRLVMRQPTDDATRRQHRLGEGSGRPAGRRGDDGVRTSPRSTARSCPARGRAGARRAARPRWTKRDARRRRPADRGSCSSLAPGWATPSRHCRSSPTPRPPRSPSVGAGVADAGLRGADHRARRRLGAAVPDGA